MGGFPRGGSGAAVTWADDLAGSTDVSQIVAALQGHPLADIAAGVTVDGFGPIGSNVQPATHAIFTGAPMMLPLTVVAATNDTFVLNPAGPGITYTIAPGTYNDATEVAAAVAAAVGDDLSVWGDAWTVTPAPVANALRMVSVAAGAGTVGYTLMDGPTSALGDMGFSTNAPCVPPGADTATIGAALPAATAFTLGTITDLESWAQPSTVMVVPDYAVVYQVQHAGEAWPRLLIVSDGSYYVSDGTFNPLQNPAGTQGLIPSGGGMSLRAGGNSLEIQGAGGNASLNSTGEVLINGATGTVIQSAELGLYGGPAVVQAAAIPDAAGGAVIDAQARTALNALLVAMRTLSAIAT